MRLIVTKVFKGDADQYLRGKIQTLLDSFPQTDAGSLGRATSVTPINLVSPEDLPMPTAEQNTQLDDLKACALAEISQDAPLLAGETLEDEVFTCLASAHGGLPAGTAVLRRTTNLAETCFLFPDVTILDSGLRVMPMRPSREADAPLVAIAGAGLISKAATMLLQKLAAAVLAELFPDNSVPGYFQEVYENIRKIVKDELTQNTVDERMGEITGVLRFVNTLYLPEKEAHGVSEDLLKRLYAQSDSMFQTIGVLMESRYEKNGLPAFLLGATVHLCTLQEIAQVRQDRGDSKGAKAEQDRAASLQAEYADHAVRVFDLLLVDRANAVVNDVDKKCSVAPGTGDVVCTYYLTWVDHVTGTVKKFEYNKGKKSPTKAEATEERKTSKAARVRSVKEVLTEDLDDPKATAAVWRKIEF